MKSYGQWCSLASALDVVGERWSLLIVRELLIGGPRRYTDLRDGIPGIATDVLASRLKDLEDDGILRRRELPPPAASKVYELTELGEGLAPAVAALARWGSRLLGPMTDAMTFRPHWLAFGLRGMLRADRAADVRLEIDFEVELDEPVRVRVDSGVLSYEAQPVGDPDIVVRSDLSTLTAISSGALPIVDATAAGRFTIEGDADAVAAFQRLFPQPRAT